MGPLLALAGLAACGPSASPVAHGAASSGSGGPPKPIEDEQPTVAYAGGRWSRSGTLSATADLRPRPGARCPGDAAQPLVTLTVPPGTSSPTTLQWQSQPAGSVGLWLQREGSGERCAAPIAGESVVRREVQLEPGTWKLIPTRLGPPMDSRFVVSLSPPSPVVPRIAPACRP